MFKRLWHDESGVVNSVDVILVTTILTLGAIVGLVCLRNQVIQELSDTASAIGSLNQSYSYEQRVLTFSGHTATVAGASFDDTPNMSSSVDVTAWPPTPRNVTPGEN